MIISEADVIGRRTGEASPLLKARIAGVLYLIIIVTAGFAEGFVRDKLVVGSDAAATANNLLTHELLYRAAGAADLINLVCDTVLALLFYELLKPVSRSLALLAAFFRLVHVAILAVSHALSLCRLGLAASRAGHAGIRDAAIAGVGTGIFEVARSGLQYLYRLFRDWLPSDGIPDLEVDFPAANSGRAAGDRGVRLHDQHVLDLSRADTGASPLSLALAARLPSGAGPCVVASYQRCQHL